MKKHNAPVVLPNYLESYAARLFQLHERAWVRLSREQLEAALREELGWLLLAEDEIAGILAAVEAKVRDAALLPGMCAPMDDGLLRR